MKEEISNNKFLLAIIVVAVIGIIVVIILMINNGNEINVYDYYSGNQREDASGNKMINLWNEGNIPTVINYTENNGGYFDDPDFVPYITEYNVLDGVDVKGAVLINPGGAFMFRSEVTEGSEVAEKLSSLGYVSFVVHYRLQPYTMQEWALDLARAVRYVRANAEVYGINPDNIAIIGFSAGGILCGESFTYDGFRISVLDSDYVPDELDEVASDVKAVGMIYAFYGRLSHASLDVDMFRDANLPPTFYAYGTEDPFYNQMNASVDALEEARVSVSAHVLANMFHEFGVGSNDNQWINSFDEWLSDIFTN